MNHYLDHRDGDSADGRDRMWPVVIGPTDSLGPGRAPAPPVRIGDAERDQAVSLLGDHFAAGRLNREELDERIDQAMQARFATDLRPLFADLPGSDPAPGRPAERIRPVPAYVPLFWLGPLLLIGAIVAAMLLSAPWIIWVFVWVLFCSGFWGRGRRFRQHGPHHQSRPGPYYR
jgi:hypothetical protein